MCELEGESIRPRLPRAGPPQLERPKRERDEAEHRRQERQPGYVADRANSERRIQNPIDPRGDRQDDERRRGTQHEAAERIEELLMGELVREDGLHFLRPELAKERVRDHDAPRPPQARPRHSNAVFSRRREARTRPRSGPSPGRRAIRNGPGGPDLRGVGSDRTGARVRWARETRGQQRRRGSSSRRRATTTSARWRAARARRSPPRPSRRVRGRTTSQDLSATRRKVERTSQTRGPTDIQRRSETGDRSRSRTRTRRPET